MQKREHALNEWLQTQFCASEFTLTPLAGDASFRRYFRLCRNQDSYVVMDAPPNSEPVTPFININNALASIGIHTPAVHAVDYAQGFVLLEDLGDRLLLKAIPDGIPDDFYKLAMRTLIKIQQCSTNDPELPVFDSPFMLQELAVFRAWFLETWLGLSLEPEEEAMLQHTFSWLASEIINQPQVFIHRDYHSRNLILVGASPHSDLGVIDFQDAMRGPFTYDLVSLLKDCYIQWPRSQIMDWLAYFYQQMNTSNLGWSLDQFTAGFEMCGLQRHLKVLGVFCRLHLRDNKAAYMRDLPLTFNYVMAFLEGQKALKPFYHFMQKRVQGVFLEKNLE